VSLVDKTRVLQEDYRKNRVEKTVKKTGLFFQLIREKKTDDKFTEKKTCEKPQYSYNNIRRNGLHIQ
jgi:hypothetical protein